jgi:uncharacterized membrane protein
MAVFIIFVLIAVLMFGEMRYNRELRNRVKELEDCLAHLYECHSYGGEISEDEHKRVMKQALQLITKVHQPDNA